MGVHLAHVAHANQAHDEVLHARRARRLCVGHGWGLDGNQCCGSPAAVVTMSVAERALMGDTALVKLRRGCGGGEKKEDDQGDNFSFGGFYGSWEGGAAG